MELFCTKIKYTREAMASIIKNKEDRSLAVEAAIKSVGGNMLGFYGMLGQKHDAMVEATLLAKLDNTYICKYKDSYKESESINIIMK